MRTIQEYLKECDRKSIINDYIYEHAFSPLDLMDEDKKDVTLGEIKNYYSEKLNGLIDRLINIEPAPQDERWILMAHHIADGDFGDMAYSLFKESDLKNEDYITSYAYEFTPFEEAVSFYVADNYLTQFEINNLIVDFLFEISWNGFEQEVLEERKEEIIKSKEDAEAHKDDPEYFVTWEEIKERMEKEFGLELEKQDPKQEDSYKELIRHQMDYNEICQRIEIDKLNELLEKEKC